MEPSVLIASEINDINSAKEFIDKLKCRIDERNTIFKNNIREFCQDDGIHTSKDSSLKKNTAFIKKLSSDSSKDKLVDEAQQLNLSQYIQEIATNILEFRFKVSDMTHLVNLISYIHTEYPEFKTILFKEISKFFGILPIKEEEKQSAINKYKLALRMVTELILNGCLFLNGSGVSYLYNLLKKLLEGDMKTFIFLQVFTNYLKTSAEDLLGIPSRSLRIIKKQYSLDIPTYMVITDEWKSKFRSIFTNYFDALCDKINEDLKLAISLEKQIKTSIGLHGDISSERRQKYDNLTKSNEKLSNFSMSLSEILDIPVKKTHVEESASIEVKSEDFELSEPSFQNNDVVNSLWEDEQQQSFYELLKDMTSLAPKKAPKESKVYSSDKPQSLKNSMKKMNKLRTEFDFDCGFSIDDDIDLNDLYDFNETDKKSSNNTSTRLFEGFMARLTVCINRDLVDKAAEEFITKFSSKFNRKKIHKLIFGLNRNRLDLLPFFSRFIATISLCWPSIGHELVVILRSDFRYQLKKKNQLNLEMKIRTIRFIGELTKFKVCPKAEALYCLRSLVNDFIHHNIDLACNLLDCCGRYLYMSPESKPIISKLLFAIRKKASILKLSSHQSNLIENSLYFCNPPNSSEITQLKLAPIEMYVHHLLYKKLGKSHIDDIVEKFHKFDWSDEQFTLFAILSIVSCWNVKYSNIEHLANFLSGIQEFIPNVAIAVVDGVIEEIRLSMEINDPCFNQRRICTAKFFAEMYNYQLIEADTLFSILYSFITFGYNPDGSSLIDPPMNYLRIRLICIILETCGIYFDKNENRLRLEYFSAYFQVYIWNKKNHVIQKQISSPDSCNPFPHDIEEMVSNFFEKRKLTLYNSKEEAHENLQAMISKYMKEYKVIDSFNGNEKMSETNLFIPSSNNVVVSDNQFTIFDDTQDNLDSLNGVNTDTINENEEIDDLDFLVSFEKIVSESLQSRIGDNTIRPSSIDMKIPSEIQGRLSTNNMVEIDSSLPIAMITKKNNKPSFQLINIPNDTEFAESLKSRQIADEAERQELKRLVLMNSRRQEEENNRGSINQAVGSTNPIKISNNSINILNSTQNKSLKKKRY